jgi:hypothetical protein
MRPQSDHRWIETFRVADLKHRVALAAGSYHCVSFLNSSRDWLFDETMNARRQKAGRDLGMRFGGNSETDGVHVANQITPVGTQLDLVLVGDLGAAGRIDVADTNKLRSAYLRQRGVDARVLLAKMTNADDCGAKHKARMSDVRSQSERQRE